ncbi:MAG: SpoIID/LytB domain-containing protein, partial [Tyzzerella sp.]|nr:SpoIID/LytB domain-containing protein [Tyzzerella sp.]
NTGKEIGTLQNINITKQGAGGVALQIVATGTKGKITVDTENKIRTALGGSGYEIEKQDGTIVKSTKLLPSAFFTIAKTGENYIIEGGGYGHGIGMSQNGANEMAKAGKNYGEILQFFYPGTEVK